MPRCEYLWQSCSQLDAGNTALFEGLSPLTPLTPRETEVMAVDDNIVQLPPTTIDVHAPLTLTKHSVVTCLFDASHVDHKRCPAPQVKEDNIAWTEQERQHARNALVPSSLPDFEERVSLPTLFCPAMLSASITRWGPCTRTVCVSPMRPT